MKKYVYLSIGIAVVALLCGCGMKAAEEAKLKERVAISEKMFKQFSVTLFGALQKAIGEKGPAGAIGVCKAVSMETEEKFAAENPDVVSARRISLKTRNPERHTPTELEKEYLERMEKEWGSDSPDAMGGSTVISDEANGTTSVLFPISVADPVCVLCHGAEDRILPEIKEALKIHYPNDNAKGYNVGDFRGAFVVVWND